MSRTVDKNKGQAEEVRQKILKKQKPSMKFPLRSLANVKYDRSGLSQMRGRRKSERLRSPP